MQARGLQKTGWRGLLVSLAIIAVALALAVRIGMAGRLSTDDAAIDADVVHVAAAVGGRIARLAVRENDLVRKGDLLFQVDPVPYQLALEQAAANVDVARAALETRRRSVAGERSNAAIADQQIRRAETNYGLSVRTEQRLVPLAAKGYVPQQQLDAAQVAQRDATTSLTQAREQARAARQAIGSADAAQAALRAAQAALANAQRALDDTVVRAPHDGRVVGLSVSSGEMVAPSQSLFTLVTTEQWYAVANFREIELGRIRVGDCATVFSMIDRRSAIKGTVEGIGAGVLSEDRINLPRSVPYVQPSLNWVRVAQRFPVRVKLERPPEALVRLGASAVVEVGSGAACR